MKKLLICLSLIMTFQVHAMAANATIKGKIYNFKDSIDFARVKIVTPGFTSMKNYEWFTDINEEGEFEMEMELEFATEMYFFFKYKYIPILLYPDSELILKFDARAFLEAREPETTVVKEGRAAEVNKWMHDFLNQYNIKFPSWKEKRRWDEMEPKAYKEYKEAEIAGKLRFAEEYLDRRVITDTVFGEWMEQHVRLLAVRDYLSFNFVYNKRTGAGPYAMMGSEYYDFWTDYAHEYPQKVLSFAYKRFVATYVNYDMLFIQQQSSDKKKPSKKEQLMEMIAKLNTDLTRHARDAALGILLGVHLDLPDLKLLVDEDLVKEVENEEIHFQLQDKYKLANGIALELKNPEKQIKLKAEDRDVLSVIRDKFPEKVVLIDVWATWCGGCIQTMRDKFPSFVRQFSPEELAVVFICVGSVENTWARRVNELPSTGYHMFANEEQFRKTQRGFNIKGLPRYILLNRRGRVELAKAPGPGAELKNKISSLLEK